MKKTIIALAIISAPALSFAQTSGTATTTVATTTATTTQAACVGAALDKRENSLITGLDAFNSAVKTAITNRLAGLKDAWSQTDKKIKLEKRIAAYKAFKTETQTANNNMRTARVNAWKTFDTDMKACGVRGHGEMPQNVPNPSGTL